MNHSERLIARISLPFLLTTSAIPYIASVQIRRGVTDALSQEAQGIEASPRKALCGTFLLALLHTLTCCTDVRKIVSAYR